MLSIEAAYEQQTSYQAADHIREQLKDTTLIAYVGGSAVGKNFLMQKSGLRITGTETSRTPRPDDDPDLYTYTDNAALLEAIERGELVQYGVHLPDLIYASRLRDFALGEPNAADIWFDAVQDLENKGFKVVKAVSVLVPGKQWEDQLDERFEGRTSDYILDRLTEARHSIRWSLAKHLSQAANHLIVINDMSDTDKTLERIDLFAHGESSEPYDEHAIQGTAAAMLKVTETYLHKLK